MEAAKIYATQLAQNLTKTAMNDFFRYIHANFYPNQDISFMEYFLELAEREGEFIVHHSKLNEYGIMTSTESGDVKKKLIRLKLIENEDFEPRHVSELRKQGGTSTTNHYHLTPEAFKKCLIRAQRRANQPIDSVIYCDYYLLLEKVFKLYCNYERDYTARLLSMKDDKIDELKNTVGELSHKIDEERAEAKRRDEEQSKQIAELIGYAKDTKATLDEVQDDLTVTKETAKVVKSLLEDKSVVSTMNPTDERKHHYFAATKYVVGPKQIVKFITGQKHYVDLQLKNKTERERNAHTVVIEPFYNANGIDLRQNIHDEFGKRRADRIKSINDANIESDRVFNANLKLEILAYNKTKPNTKRYFSEEKRKTPLIKLKDISVEFTKLSFVYIKNPHMSFEEILQIINDVNTVTQESPFQSDEE